MNIQPNGSASLAGTSHAAARGGEADNQAAEATRQQARTDRPAGKSSDSKAVDAGDEAGDRGGNGSQMLDVFEHSEEQEGTPEDRSPDRRPASGEGTGEHLDLEA